MARLTNISGQPLDLYTQAGEAESFHVPAGETVEVPGDVMNADAEDADFFIIGEGEAARSWPKASWQVSTAEKDEKSEGKTRGSRKTDSEE